MLVSEKTRKNWRIQLAAKTGTLETVVICE